MHQNLFIDFCFLSIGWFEFCILHNLFSFQENQCVCLFVQKATFNNNGILLGNYINSKIYYRVHRHRKRKRFNTWKKTKNTVTLRLFYKTIVGSKSSFKATKKFQRKKKTTPCFTIHMFCFDVQRLRNLNFSKKWF